MNSGSLLDMMVAHFEKLPDDHIISKSDISRERKAWGRKVREARKKANLTLKEMAQYLGLSVSRIGQMECGIITEKQAKKILISLSDYPIKEKDSIEQSISEKNDVIIETDICDCNVSVKAETYGVPGYDLLF